MGKIFTNEEIRKGRVPGPSDFSQVVEVIKNSFGSGKCPGAKGVMILGSVANGQANARSDIDLLVVYQDPFGPVQHHLSQVNERAQERNVPIDFILLEKTAATLGLTSIGHSFHDHLKIASGENLVHGNPVELIVPQANSRQSEVSGYLARKIEKLRNGLVAIPSMEEPERVVFLQNVCEVSNHAVRKMLWLRGHLKDDDSKTAVIGRFRELANEEELEIFNRVLLVDRHYTETVTAADRNERLHRQAIREIVYIIPDVQRFLEILLMQLAPIASQPVAP